MVMYKKTFLILGCLFFAWAAMPAGAQLENLLPGGSDEPAAVTEEKDDLGASLAKWKEESEQKAERTRDRRFACRCFRSGPKGEKAKP